jgi:hypothetical protein
MLLSKRGDLNCPSLLFGILKSSNPLLEQWNETNWRKLIGQIRGAKKKP